MRMTGVRVDAESVAVGESVREAKPFVALRIVAGTSSMRRCSIATAVANRHEMCEVVAGPVRADALAAAERFACERGFLDTPFSR